ncbi:hypothetical protein [Mesorhizobium sp. NZP2298]|uniref:hypothetical protein n=1 Tax=Mesorhizobium sp. NZP2298 TaxID=2483403 RepID=UPI001FEEC3FE|nr:hypothetical protein [Mesorhizobium sp. NZP2298]
MRETVLASAALTRGARARGPALSTGPVSQLTIFRNAKLADGSLADFSTAPASTRNRDLAAAFDVVVD